MTDSLTWWGVIWRSVVFVLAGAIFYMDRVDAQNAQDGNERARLAAPFLAQQLHDAVDNLAICQGDQAALRQQLADAKAELEKLKAAPPK